MDNERSTDVSIDDAPGRNTYCREIEAILDIGNWYLDLDRAETAWSERVYEMFEVSATDEPFGHDEILEFVAPPHESRVERERTAVWDGESFDIEYRIETDGSTKWVRERAEVKRDSEGCPVAVIGVFQDITDQKEYERELELFRNLVDESSDGFFVIDPETGDIVDVNETACQLLGYDREELLSLSVSDINPEFSREKWHDFAETVQESGETVLEGKHRRKDGSTFPVEIHASYVSLRRDYHVATVRDITDRREREQQLEAARKRYQTLIDAAPDPIFVADVETGELVEANTSAADLRNQPRDEIVGLHQAALHPEDKRERYQELFEYHANHPGTIRKLDGEPLYLTTADGDRIPVAISTATVELGDETLIHGIFRDVSEQRRYENALEGINAAAQDLLHADTDVEIARIVVDAAANVLGASGSGVCLYDEHAGELAPAAYSEGLDEMLDEVPHFSPGDSIAWRVFATQEQERFDDVRTTDDVYNAGTLIRSELLIPLGEHGVFIVGDTEVEALDDVSVEIAETLATTAEAALDRAERVQTLRKRERESQLQAQRLERVNRLNTEIRTVMQVLMQAQSREAITQQVCDSLVNLDRFKYAWIGEPDHAANEIRIRAQSGSPQQYLDAISLAISMENPPPAVRAIRDRTTISEPQIAAAPHQADWKNAALRHDFRSVVSVPLVYDGFLYGVLTIYSSQPEDFNDTTRSVLAELGELIGYVLNATDQRHALLGGKAIDVTLDLSTGTDPFVELAVRLAAEFQVENITPRSGDAYLVQFVSSGVAPDRVQSVTDDLPSMTDYRTISDGDPAVHEVSLIGDCLATTLGNVGANIRSIVVSENHCRITMSIPEGRDRQTLVRHLKDEYPDIDLTIKQYSTSLPSVSRTGLLEDALTDRQRDILETAYYSGFFDQHRKRTGTQIADSLDISQPAFSTQLRAAQRNLLAAVFER